MSRRPSTLLILGFFVSIVVSVQLFDHSGSRWPSLTVLLDLIVGSTPPSQSHQLFESKVIRRSAKPQELPVHTNYAVESVLWKGKVVAISEFLSATNTRAFLVVQDGKVIHETYSNQYDKTSKFSSFSVAKSFVTTLVGAAVLDGRIRSLSDPIGDYLGSNDLPEALRLVTIEQLLSMRSGIDVDERYTSVFSPVVQMYLTTDLGDFVARLKGFRYPSGERFEYRSVDTLVLAKVLTRATGMSLAEYLEAKIWNPLGAADDASWSVDSRDHNVEKAFCCLNATARDFARLGILYLARGAAGGGDHIVSESWAIAPATTRNRSSEMTYHDGWWILPDNERDGDFAAIGIYGQYVYVNPRTQTTIVKLSEHGLEKDEIETLLTLRYIADAASGTQKDQM